METAPRFIRRLFMSGIALLFLNATPALAQDQSGDLLKQGLHDCASTNFTQALSSLQTAYVNATQTSDKVKAAAALAQTYVQVHQEKLAEPYLRFAFETETDKLDKAGYAIDFANWQQQQGHVELARSYYDTALQLAGQDAGIYLSASLNRQRLEAKNLAPAARLNNLQLLSQRLSQISDELRQARFSLNLGAQAKTIGPQGLALAFQSLDHARQLAQKHQQPRLLLEALDQLAQMYEDAHRFDDALALTGQALLAAQGVEAHDLLINIEWRQGRILRQQGKYSTAIAAYQRAVWHIEAIRADIPVEYQDGRSSFRETLEPVYLGLADLLLQTADQLEPKEKNQQLRRARDVLELSRQTELQDYLGDRCAVDTARANRKVTAINADTAILYPVVLPERLELLLETSQGMSRYSVPVTASALHDEVIDFNNTLKDELSFKAKAVRLYRTLLAPVAAGLQQAGVATLVIVPDGVLRLTPFSALYDGQQFAIEKYAIAVVPALSLTNTSERQITGTAYQTLLAGMSKPGAVVGKLPGFMVTQLLATDQQTVAMADRQLGRGALIRGMSAIRKSGTAAAESHKKISDADSEKLQHLLALAGVDEEIHALEKLAPGQTLLNDGFTVSAFSQKLKTGNYQIVHIASHGVFGGTADSTFLMAHDDLITMDKLQGFLRSSAVKNQELELLTLSACETAEGDDRAPLGLSGAALKAHARSALGSLWPVADEAATMLMEQFYRHLAMAGMSKAQALRQAQLELLKSSRFNHPFYWAPFIMVGSWL